MSRVQLALNVADIDAAVDFYRKLFGAEPAKRRPGYANFAIAEPPLKLVLIEDKERTRACRRSTTWASRSRPPTRSPPRRPGSAGQSLDTLLQENTACCYAVQDKVWVNDPDGRRGSGTPCWPTADARLPASSTSTPVAAPDVLTPFGRPSTPAADARRAALARRRSPSSWAPGCWWPSSSARASPPSGSPRTTSGSNCWRTQPPPRPGSSL